MFTLDFLSPLSDKVATFCGPPVENSGVGGASPSDDGQAVRSLIVTGPHVSSLKPFPKVLGWCSCCHISIKGQP